MSKVAHALRVAQTIVLEREVGMRHLLWTTRIYGRILYLHGCVQIYVPIQISIPGPYLYDDSLSTRSQHISVATQYRTICHTAAHVPREKLLKIQRKVNSKQSRGLMAAEAVLRVTQAQSLIVSVRPLIHKFTSVSHA